MEEKFENIPEETGVEEVTPAETSPEEAEVAETAENSEAVPVEALSNETPDRPAGLLRSAITAVIVLAVFAAVYFIYTAFVPEKTPSTEPEQSKPNTEMSVSENPENAKTPEEAPSADITNPEKPDAAQKPSAPQTSAATEEEEPSPEYTAATDKITASAKKKYGDGVMVLPEYNSQLKTVKMDGKEIKCYLAAAVKMTSDNGSLPIIHAACDAKTGEVWFEDEKTWEVLD